MDEQLATERSDETAKAYQAAGQCLPSVASSYLEAGLSAFPAIRADKYPTGLPWGKYQKKRMDQPEVPRWFRTADAICIICGAASGNLEVLDFDDGGSHFEPWKEKVFGVAPELLSSLVIERSPSGGYHAFYRCTTIQGNLKLAYRDARLLIETRGQGGLIVCDPTPGYELIQGRLTAIPTITPAQRDFLLTCARSFDVPDGPSPPVQQHVEPSRPVGPADDSKPWGDYNQRGDFRNVLTNAGWVKVRDPIPGDDNERWRRPGKAKGHSATINRDRTFYCWSSNASPFELQKAYSPFEVYAKLEHDGDIKAAGRALGDLGYGVRDDLGTDTSGIENQPVEGHHRDDGQQHDQDGNAGGNQQDGSDQQRPKLAIGGLEAYEALLSYVPPPALPTADAAVNPNLASIQVRRGEMLLIGGAPGSGKTGLVYQMAFDAMKNDQELRVVSCNVEMTPNALLTRQLARWSAQSATDIAEGRIPVRDDRLKDAHATLHGVLPRVAFMLAPYNVARLGLLVDECQPHLLIVDYLQRITCVGHKDKRQELNAVLERLRDFASRGIAILALSGLARSKGKSGASSYANSIGLAAFRETSELEYAVDRAYVATVEDPGEPQSEVTLHCCKNRHGQQKDALLGADFVTQTFSDPFGQSMSLDQWKNQVAEDWRPPNAK